MRPIPRRGAVLLAAGVLLALAWIVAPLPAPPLYDGLQLPQEPYRYLKTPPGQVAGPPPAPAHVALAIAGGKAPIAVVRTGESPAQARLILQYNAIRVPRGISRVILSIHAVPAPPPPSGYAVDGNVYRFGATTPGGQSLTLRPGPKVSVELRGTGITGNPAVEQYRGGKWVKLNTIVLLGTDVFLANVKSFGDFALIIPAGQAAIANGSTSTLPFLIVGVAVVIMLVVAVLLIRINRGKRAGSGAARRS